MVSLKAIAAATKRQMPVAPYLSLKAVQRLCCTVHKQEGVLDTAASATPMKLVRLQSLQLPHFPMH